MSASRCQGCAGEVRHTRPSDQQAEVGAHKPNDIVTAHAVFLSQSSPPHPLHRVGWSLHTACYHRSKKGWNLRIPPKMSVVLPAVCVSLVTPWLRLGVVSRTPLLPVAPPLSVGGAPAAPIHGTKLPYHFPPILPLVDDGRQPSGAPVKSFSCPVLVSAPPAAPIHP